MELVLFPRHDDDSTAMQNPVTMLTSSSLSPLRAKTFKIDRSSLAVLQGVISDKEVCFVA